MSVWNYALKKNPPQAKGGGLSWERVVAGRMMEDVTAGGLVAPTCRAVVNEGGNRTDRNLLFDAARFSAGLEH